jgi:peptidyl-prolyl cis-trans isomerase C
MRFRVELVLFCLAACCPLVMAQKSAPSSTAANGYIVSAHAASIPSAPPARLVARVNGAELTDHDLLREMYAIFPYAKQHNGGFPKEMEPEIRRGALKMIEFEELVYQEASRRHLAIAPDRLAKSEKQFRQQFEADQQYQYFLKTEAHGSQEVLRTKIKRSLLIEDLLQEQVADKSNISEAEAKAYYQNNPQAFKMPETYALQTITVLSPNAPGTKQPAPAVSKPAVEKQMRARAEDELKQARATKNFEEFGVLAEKISDDDYRVMMGDHKAVSVKEIPAPILAAVSKMQVGQVSDLILVDGAYTIVRLNAHSLARMQTIAEVEPSLKPQMQHSKNDRLRRELDARLRKNAKIEEL